MNLMTAKTLISIGNSLGVDLELYNDYSGRGMYGRTTTGVISSNSKDISIVIDEINTLMEDDEAWSIEDDNGDEIDINYAELERGITNLRHDNLGKSDYIYY
jgi:hypothetical protein